MFTIIFLIDILLTYPPSVFHISKASHQPMTRLMSNFFQKIKGLLNTPKFNRAVEVRTSEVRIGTAGHSETIAFHDQNFYGWVVTEKYRVLQNSKQLLQLFLEY